MAKNALKLSTIVGENVEICSSQIARNALKLTTMVGENVEIYNLPMTRNAFLSAKKYINLPRKFPKSLTYP